LVDAVRRVVWASATPAVYAIVVDAKNDRVEAFYKQYDCRAFASEQRRLFLPLENFEWKTSSSMGCSRPVGFSAPHAPLVLPPISSGGGIPSNGSGFRPVDDQRARR